MENIILIYECDVHHSNDSKRVIGCAKSFNIAMELIGTYCTMNDLEFCQEDFLNLRNISQTQQNSAFVERDSEFILEYLTVNNLV